MIDARRCSRSGCSTVAVATLTYVYGDSTVVIGPLAGSSEPHSYDLCDVHARRLTAPRGWEVVRNVREFPAPEPGHADDLEALARAVREATGFAVGSAGSAGAAGYDVAPPGSGLPGRGGGLPGAAGRRAGARPAVRSAGTPRGGTPAPGGSLPTSAGARRGHLRVVPSPAD